MVDHAWIRENVGVADVIQILGFPLKREHPRTDPTNGRYYHVWRGRCPACKGGPRSLVATEVRGFTCFQRKIGINPDQWLSGDAIALYAHIQGVSMREAAEAIANQFAF